MSLLLLLYVNNVANVVVGGLMMSLLLVLMLQLVAMLAYGDWRRATSDYLAVDYLRRSKSYSQRLQELSYQRWACQAVIVENAHTYAYIYATAIIHRLL